MMESDADGQGQQRRGRERDGAESLQRPELAEVVAEIGGRHAVGTAQPALQAAVVSVDVVDVPGSGRMLACAGVDGVALYLKMAGDSSQHRLQHGGQMRSVQLRDDLVAAGTGTLTHDRYDAD